MGTQSFLAVNRNKRSIALNLKSEEHRAVLHRLAREADVVLENYRPGVAAKLGAGWEELSELNPRLIYASVSGFGQTGPYAQRPGYDLIAQGLSGVMSVTGEPDGEPGQVRHPDRRPVGRPVLRRGDPQRGDRARAHRRGPADRHVAVRGRSGAVDLGDGRAVVHRRRPPAARVRAPGDRALPGAAHRRRAHHGRRQQPEAVAEAVRGDRPARAGRGPALREQRRPDGQPARAGDRAGVGAGRAAPPTSGSRR